MKVMKPMAVKVSHTQKMAWVKEASRLGMGLSAWMRWVLDAAVLPCVEELRMPDPPRGRATAGKRFVMCAECERRERIYKRGGVPGCTECRWE